MCAGRPHLNTLDNAPSTTINNKGLLKINTDLGNLQSKSSLKKTKRHFKTPIQLIKRFEYDFLFLSFFIVIPRSVFYKLCVGQ